MRNHLAWAALGGLLLASAPSSALAAVTLRYHNGDSVDHKWEAKIAGSSSSVTFEHSRTASVTIQGGASTAVIATPSGSVTVKDGDSIDIKDGRIKVD